MLRFHPAAERDLPRLRREGLPEGAPLLGSIEAARREAGGPRGDDAGRVLVVSAVARQTELDEASGDAQDGNQVVAPGHRVYLTDAVEPDERLGHVVDAVALGVEQYDSGGHLEWGGVGKGEQVSAAA